MIIYVVSKASCSIESETTSTNIWYLLPYNLLVCVELWMKLFTYKHHTLIIWEICSTEFYNTSKYQHISLHNIKVTVINISTDLTRKIQILGCCQPNGGRHKSSKILIFAWKLNSIISNKYCHLFSLNLDKHTSLCFEKMSAKYPSLGNHSLSTSHSF